MNDQRPARIALVSDQPIFLRGLNALVSGLKGFHLVGEGCCGEEALQLCQMTAPHLLVLALDDGPQLLQQIHSQSPLTRIVVLQSTQDSQPDNGALAGLPVFFFSRDLNEEEFKTAITKALDAPGPDGPDDPAQAGKPTGGELASQEPEEHGHIIYRSAVPSSEEVMARELLMAGKIQSDILPEEPPVIRGWEIAATLSPARETSGDFYDFIPLGPRKWGIVIADVSDKGMGAALLMALASTLFRTFAVRYPTLPAVTLDTINQRILSDTRGGMFITAFLGNLEQHTGRMVFANAGHPPGFLVSLHRGKESIERLRLTGMALGVDEQSRWRQKEVRLGAGDFLVLYTDGITEAQNEAGDFFGEERVLEAALSRAGASAREIHDAILAEVHRFLGSLPRQDDVALIVLRRLEGEK